MSEYVPTAKRRPLTTARVRIAAVSDRDVDCVPPDSFDVWLDGERAAARREGQAEANAALAERVADYADATYDLIDSPNGARLAFEYIVAMIRGEVNL